MLQRLYRGQKETLVQTLAKAREVKGDVSLNDSTNIEISLAIEKKCLKEVKGGYGIGQELVAWAQGVRFGRDALEMEHNIKGSAKVIS